MENGRHKVSNVKVRYQDCQPKPEEVFNKLESAAKINIALGFVLRNVETGENRYCYALENNIFVREIAFTVYESGFDYNPGTS